MPDILIVDDEAAIRESLKGVLEDEGYKTAAAASGEACIEWLSKKPCDVVLLDIWLPGMDGTRDQFLARPRFAEDQDAAIGRGH